MPGSVLTSYNQDCQEKYQQPQICRWYHSNDRKWRGTKNLLRVCEESEKSGLKFNIEKSKIMATGPITSWQIYREKVETVTDFLFLGSKITANGDFSHEIQRPLLLRIKAMTNLDSILKSRNITSPAKVHIVKAVVFLVIMYGCESWIINKAECWRIDAFKLWCWRRLLDSKIKLLLLLLCHFSRVRLCATT